MAILPYNITLSSSQATLIFMTTQATANVNLATQHYPMGTPNAPRGFLIFVPATPAIYVCASTATTTTGGVLLTASSVISLNVVGPDNLYLIAASGTPSVGLLVAGL